MCKVYNVFSIIHGDVCEYRKPSAEGLLYNDTELQHDVKCQLAIGMLYYKQGRSTNYSTALKIENMMIIDLYIYICIALYSHISVFLCAI